MVQGIMSIIPAHLMRSVGGEFDNEACLGAPGPPLSAAGGSGGGAARGPIAGSPNVAALWLG